MTKVISSLALDPVQRALTTTIPASEARNTLADVRAAAVERDAEIARTRQTALDPLESEAGAAKARAALMDLEFRRARVKAQEDALSARVDELEREEADLAWQAEVGAATAERDALAAEIRDRYPVLAEELAGLIGRIEDSDRRLAAVGAGGGPRLPSAEAVARECPGNFYLGGAPVTRFRSLTLPALKGDGPPIWSRRSN